VAQTRLSRPTKQAVKTETVAEGGTEAGKTETVAEGGTEGLGKIRRQIRRQGYIFLILFLLTH